MGPELLKVENNLLMAAIFFACAVVGNRNKSLGFLLIFYIFCYCLSMNRWNLWYHRWPWTFQFNFFLILKFPQKKTFLFVKINYRCWINKKINYFIILLDKSNSLRGGLNKKKTSAHDLCIFTLHVILICVFEYE